MNRLSSVIGAAPSESSWFELKKRIQREHERVRQSFDLWKQKTSVKQKRKATSSTKGLSVKDMRTIANSLNITLEELNELYQKGELKSA